LAYVGADAQLLPADRLSVRGIGTVAWGEMTFTTGSSTHNFALSSWAASAEVSYGLTSRMGIGAFTFALSGDLPAVPDGSTTDYHGFIGIAPYWTWTGLFFSGGISQGLYPGRATAAGVNGHGVAGGGARLDWSGESLYGEVRAASMWALADPPLFGGLRRWYGFEVDGVLEWDVWAWATLAIEADVLWPGGFFPQRDVAFRLIGQLHVHASKYYP
jgi:hypothetical protein